MKLKIILAALLLPIAYIPRVSAQTDTSTVEQPDTDANDKKGTDDLMTMLEKDAVPAGKPYTTATFKATRIANGHSIENVGKGVLDFRIMHRFGTISNGMKDFFGMDNANTMIGFDYGITNWLMVGIARSSFLQEYNGFFKVKLLRQTDDDRMPFSLSYMGASSVRGARELPESDKRDYYFSNRMAYINQLLIARKFNRRLSLQLMPTYVHYNLVDFKDEPNNIFTVGIGGRLKLSNRISLTAEYYYLTQENRLRGSKSPLTIGIDIETGGHVFQLMFSNSQAVSERNVLGKTTESWGAGDLHFGFNISRVFTVVRPKEFKDSRNKIW